MSEELKKVIDRLWQHINNVPAKFLKYSEEELRRKPTPGKWFKKEIMGHIIEAAANSQARDPSDSGVVESMKTIVLVARKL